MVMPLKYVRSRMMPRGAIAFTAWPFCFVAPGILITPRLRSHEGMHGEQQLVAVVLGVLAAIGIGGAVSWPPSSDMALVCLVWAVEGYALGHLAWRWLYLIGFPLGLPVGWNPWRRWWETEAMLAEGRSAAEVEAALKNAPYYLWG